MRRARALAAAAVVLAGLAPAAAGCGFGEGGEKKGGAATLRVTRDFGHTEIGSVRLSHPRFFTNSSESVMLPSDENGDGIITHNTFSGPIASTASAATSDESIPPDNPSRTFSKPFLRA